MASAEIQTVIEMLRSTPPITGDDIAQMRASMEAATSVVPLPDDVTYDAVDAGGVPAEWASAPGAAPERAVVYFHGGGYVLGSVRTHRHLVGEISRVSAARVLSVDYRLGPEHPFPAAVEDGVVAYRWVRHNGLDPSGIALAGDSAGGGLTAATLLAVRDAGDRLPATAVCISPWLDLTLSGESMTTKAAADPLVQAERLRLMAEAYLAGTDPRTPHASPLYADLTGLPPLLLHVGTAEVLLDDSVRFSERARTAGVQVDLEVWDDMIHAWHAFTGLLPEAQQALDRVGEYLRTKLA